MIITGWTVLWAVTNPPGAAPDEPSHYVKAVAAGTGDLVGRPVRFASLQRLHAFSPASLRQVRHAYRAFTIPARLRTQTNPPCTAFRDGLPSAACLATPRPTPKGEVYSIVGAYPPWFYLPGGALATLGSSVRSGYLLARLGSALAACLLLAGGTWLLLERARRPTLLLVGLAVAVTPMAVFLTSEVGSNGAETLGAVASSAAFLRLSRPDPPPRPAVWWVAGALLALTAMSRPLAPVWILFGCAVALARLSLRGSWRRFRDGGAPAAGAAVLAVLGMLASLGWTQALKVRTPVLWDQLGHGMRTAWQVAPAMARQAVGVFGWQDTTGPDALYRAWWLVGLVLLVAAALVAHRWRDRLVLVGATLGVGVLYEVIAAAVFEQNGFGMQGRYILPALVMLPLLAADILAERLPERRVPAAGALGGGVIALVGVGQFVGWWTNAHRYAVGRRGPLWFPPSAQWSPPGGWPLSVGITIGLTALTVAVGVLAAQGPGKCRGGRTLIWGDTRV